MKNFIKITTAICFLVTIASVQSCTTVKEYEKNKLNDAEMVLGNRTIEKTELSFQSYREGFLGSKRRKSGRRLRMQLNSNYNI
ncbi:hypothetical protein J3D55_002301 [Chryseobacterium ginsenosidimutans]|uniref:DUF4266 domain-containing protein n=1 Tax=Chryseobacterium ginsenosidimutans TaxID=687846 RepID=UPI00404379C1|nr:hypothetical protein [Chryseobacterium ginsenosidimutans]